ncbi:SPW repeat protein [Streptacidiphilus rugosus]|uniref:SPW repeat protein n=1 Tax=Streptacidiphilus rugosus TaxID=405783 RepID=UPI001E424EFC|nr:SPW repeat protein [Streptacidiphilus rugosus]
MRERYARMLEGGRPMAVDGLMVLAGLYAAISPWVVHFRTASTELTLNNLIIGLAVAAIGLGLSLGDERAARLSWTCAPIGVWMIISPWVVTIGHTASRGMIWNNVIVGAVICALGLAATRMLMGTARSRR